MNYQKLYESIILKAQYENRKKNKSNYFENHHIIPRCIGGSDDKENLVLLTAKEHFICHRLLCEIYEEPKLKYAYWAMCNQVFGDVKRDYRISSRTYEYARSNFSVHFSEFMKNLPEEKRGFKKGSKHSEETKANWSKNRKGKNTGEQNTFFGKTHTKDTKNRIGEKRKEFLKTPEGKLSEEIRLKNSSQRKPLFCPELNKDFLSIGQAAKYFSETKSHIQYILSKKQGKYKEYTLIYVK